MPNKKSFTLIEMLIVVVIIGILAAALIPRLQSVQARARDTKRKADLHQIGTALAIYKEDNGGFDAFKAHDIGNITYSTTKTKEALNHRGSAPEFNFSVDAISRYMTSIPADSNDTNRYPNGQNVVGYGRGPIPQHGKRMDDQVNEVTTHLNAFVVFTRSETVGGANRVSKFWAGGGYNIPGKDQSDIRNGDLGGFYSLHGPADGYEQRICNSIELSGFTTNNESGSCAANKDSDDLRYIYVN